MHSSYAQNTFKICGKVSTMPSAGYQGAVHCPGGRLRRGCRSQAFTLVLFDPRLRGCPYLAFPSPDNSPCSCSPHVPGRPAWSPNVGFYHYDIQISACQRSTNSDLRELINSLNCFKTLKQPADEKKARQVLWLREANLWVGAAASLC